MGPSGSVNTQHFCTYFDHRYLSRGLALHASLLRHSPQSILWVLCLSESCAYVLTQLALPSLRIIKLSELELFDPELAACKANRSLIEYYFSCSPCLPRFVMEMVPDASWVSYLDSDMYFFAEADGIFKELQESSVGITPHRFTAESFASHGKYGNFNVGLLCFRRDEAGIGCLEWWRSQCLNWCHDRLEGNRYADQKYLEHFESLFPGVRALEHPGINLAPWNIGNYQISGRPGFPLVQGRPVIIFHFQGLRRIFGQRFDCNLTGYGARLSEQARTNIFRPYIVELDAIESGLITAGLVSQIESSARRSSTGLLYAWRRFKTLVLQLQAIMHGNTLRI